MGGKVAVGAYVALCVVIAACAVYYAAGGSISFVRYTSDPDAEERRRRAVDERFAEYRRQQREEFRADVASAVSSALSARALAEATD